MAIPVPKLRLDGNPVEHRRQIATAIQALADGRLNVTGELTLTPGATTTTLSDRRLTPSSVVLLSPKTANAAGALATTYIVPGTGQATVNHANAASADRTFGFVFHGD